MEIMKTSLHTNWLALTTLGLPIFFQMSLIIVINHGKNKVFYPKVDINNLILGHFNKGVFHNITKHFKMVTFIPSHGSMYIIRSQLDL